MLTLKTNSLQTKEEILEIENPSLFKWNNIFSTIQRRIQDKENKYLIKLNLVKTTKDKLYFNIVSIEGVKGFIAEPFSPCQKLKAPPKARLAIGGKSQKPDISCLIIPTGIGAVFGGYAGDANSLAKLFAQESKYLLTHPNIVNGAVLSDVPSNLIYLDGFFLDQFLLGKI